MGLYPINPMKGGVRSCTSRILVGATSADTPADFKQVISESIRHGFLVGGLMAVIHGISTAVNFG